MNSIGSKPLLLRLDPATYETLRQQILRRDGWRCQACGTMSNLEVHHEEFRSHAGEDSEQNLMTLCSKCHDSAHRPGNETDRAGARRKESSFTAKWGPQLGRRSPPGRRSLCSIPVP